MSAINILAIAVDEYSNKGIPALGNCKKDMDAVLGVLQERYAVADMDLIYKKEDTTQKALYARVRDFLGHATDKESLLLLFAGHGQYNPLLGTAYWQPSDADPEDPSSWFNITELMAFLKASPALHVGVICDTCFGGALFEDATRGGGREAMTNRRSREALSSGGIERVSEGKDGGHSPFAQTLVRILAENEKQELPFLELSMNVIEQFDPKRKQTPRMGFLDHAGHDGGILFLERKATTPPEEPAGDKNGYLQSEMRHLYIPVPPEWYDRIDQLGSLTAEKNRYVRAQKFEEAAAIRDEERKLDEAIKADLPGYIAHLVKGVSVSSESAKALEALKQETVAYEKRRAEEEAKRKAAEPPQRTVSTAELMDFGVEKGVIAVVTKGKGDKSSFVLEVGALRDRPAVQFFAKQRPALVAGYERGCIELYAQFMSTMGTSEIDYLVEKRAQLEAILVSILWREIRLLASARGDFLDRSIERIRLESELLTWIKAQ